MLRKAGKENIVVDLTNLYDHFFVQTGECRAKVTAARLPYFDGDYWPGAAEDLINQLNQEEDGRKQNKKGTTKKTITKRALKASGQSDLSGNASKDLLLMHKVNFPSIFCYYFPCQLIVSNHNLYNYIIRYFWVISLIYLVCDCNNCLFLYTLFNIKLSVLLNHQKSDPVCKAYRIYCTQKEHRKDLGVPSFSMGLVEIHIHNAKCP